MFDPLFLTTRETFPGEKSFARLCGKFFGSGSSGERTKRIAGAWTGEGLLVHMANPEQLDDLFAHIDRETRVRFLPTTYIHRDIRPTVYSIGRGTGILLDHRAVAVEHVSVSDAATVRDPEKNLVASGRAKLPTLASLHRELSDNPRSDWNEVNVSFDGAGPIVGFFSLDGVMSKLYATVLRLKAAEMLPVFAYNRERNDLFLFEPTRERVETLISQVPVPAVRARYVSLLEQLSTGQTERAC